MVQIPNSFFFKVGIENWNEKQFPTFGINNGNEKQSSQPNLGKKWQKNIGTKFGRGIPAHAWYPPLLASNVILWSNCHTFFKSILPSLNFFGWRKALCNVIFFFIVFRKWKFVVLRHYWHFCLYWRQNCLDCQYSHYRRCTAPYSNSKIFSYKESLPQI